MSSPAVLFFLFFSFISADEYYYSYYDPLSYGPEPFADAPTEPTPVLGARAPFIPIEGILLLPLVLNSLHGSALR